MIRGLSSRFGRGGGTNSTNDNNNNNNSSRRRRGRRPSEQWRGGRTSLNDEDDEYESSSENDRNLQHHHSSDGDSSINSDDIDDNQENENHSVHTNITVETVRTKENENKKPVASPDNATMAANTTVAKSPQIFIGSQLTAEIELQLAVNDTSKSSIYLKNINVSKHIASKMVELIRGDNRSWEAVAVDMLRRQKVNGTTVRWDSIILDGCTSSSLSTPPNNSASTKSTTAPPGTIGIGSNTDVNGTGIVVDEDDLLDNENTNDNGNDWNNNTNNVNYLDLLLSTILHLNNCSYLHISNYSSWSLSTSISLSSIIYSKSIMKLQLDFITDLYKYIPTLSAALKENTSVTCLIASRCGLEDVHLGMLLGNLPQNLEELRLFGNKCRRRGLASLTETIKHRKKSRSKYKLLKNKVQKSSTAFRPLKIIDLSYQHVSPQEMENNDFDISSFATALCDNKTLRTLDFDNDALNDTQLSYLIKALCRNKTLEELMLNHNQISDVGVAVLASKFTQMKGLKKISMYSNAFDTSSTTTNKTATTTTTTTTTKPATTSSSS